MQGLIDGVKSLFCQHRWKLIDEAVVYEYEYDKYPLGRKRTYICEKCLKRKIIKTC